jgi:hypothetical protein
VPNQHNPIVLSEGLYQSIDRSLQHWLARRVLFCSLLWIVAVVLNHDWLAGPQPGNHFWLSVGLTTVGLFLYIFMPIPHEEHRR